MSAHYSHLLRIIAFVCFGAMAAPGVELTWISPIESENEQFPTTSKLHQDGGLPRGVPIIVELSEHVPFDSSLEIHVDGSLVCTFYGVLAPTGRPQYAVRMPIPLEGVHVFSAKLKHGLDVTTFPGPSVEIVLTEVPITFEAKEATDITLNRVRFHADVNNRGYGLLVYYFEYGPTSDYGFRSPLPFTTVIDPFSSLPSPERVSRIVSFESWATDLLPGTEYHYRLVVRQSLGGGQTRYIHGPDMVVSTLPNQTPVARDDIAVLNPDGSCDVYATFNDSDENADLLAIVDVSTPAHGTATISQTGNPSIRYVSDSSFETSDEFTCKVRDPYGAEATAKVVIRSIDEHYVAISGDYATVALDQSQIPIASVSVNAHKKGKYTGALTFHGTKFPFVADFAPVNGMTLTRGEFHFPRPGFQPLHFVFTAWPNGFDDGIPYISGEIEDYGNVYLLEYAPQLLPVGVVVPEAGQFNVALPNPDAPVAGLEAPPAPPAPQMRLKALAAGPAPDAEGTPQGHGFAIMKMSPRGHLKIAGRLGDNKPFTAAARMRRDRKVQILSRCGVAQRGNLYGVLGFDVANGAGGSGTLRWSNPDRASGIYRAAFNLQIDAEGRTYSPRIARTGVFRFPEGAPRLVKVTVRDHGGAIIADETMTLARGNRLDNGRGKAYRLRIAINPANGQFTGTLARPGYGVISITGLVQPASRRGVGVAGATGYDGPVELVAL